MDETYLEKLKKWGLYVAAILALAIAGALAQRFIGIKVDLPPPPVFILQTDDGSAVKVFEPGKCQCNPAGQCGNPKCGKGCCPCCEIKPKKE